MLWGLMSRWTMPAPWSASSPAATSEMTRTSSATPERRRLRDAIAERAPGDVVDRQVVAPVRLGGLDDRDEMRVVHLGGGARLLAEPVLEDEIAGELDLEHLQRDLAAVLGPGRGRRGPSLPRRETPRAGTRRACRRARAPAWCRRKPPCGQAYGRPAENSKSAWRRLTGWCRDSTRDHANCRHVTGARRQRAGASSSADEEDRSRRGLRDRRPDRPEPFALPALGETDDEQARALGRRDDPAVRQVDEHGLGLDPGELPDDERGRVEHAARVAAVAVGGAEELQRRLGRRTRSRRRARGQPSRGRRRRRAPSPRGRRRSSACPSARRAPRRRKAPARAPGRRLPSERPRRGAAGGRPAGSGRPPPPRRGARSPAQEGSS